MNALTRNLGRWLGRPAPADPVKQAGPELRAQVRSLEIRARRAIDTGISGRFQSAFKGRGLEFEEVREYRRGDDVRTIAWNVTARTGSLHVKRYREERDLTVLLLVDLSASTRFGSGVMTVHDLISETASLFALSASREDRVGAIAFDDEIRKIIPPRSGWRHGLRIVREILGAVPAGRGTAMEKAILSAGRLLHHRGVVIVLTDCSSVLPDRQLKALASRHEVVVVRVGDRLLERGNGMPIPAVDAESGRSWTAIPGEERHTGPEVFAGVDMVKLDTAEDYLPAIRALLEGREKRRVR